MAKPELTALLEKLASEAMLATVQSAPFFEELMFLVEDLATLDEEGQLKDDVETLRNLSDKLVAAPATEHLVELRGICDRMLISTQQTFRDAAEFIDDPSVVAEYLSAQAVALEEVENLALQLQAMDQVENDELLRELKRLLHTLKGDAGAAGRSTISKVYHRLEDAIAGELSVARQVDLILAVIDWTRAANEMVARGECEQPDATAVLQTIDFAITAPPTGQWEPVSQPAEPIGAIEQTRSSTESATQRPATDAARRPVGLVRDEDTLEVIGEFLEESDEGLAQVDQVLVDAEQSGIDAEGINKLFRVFHTLKGVAAFLEFNEIKDLGHITETFLNMARDGDVVLAGSALDLIFDSTAMMRRLLDRVRVAVARSEDVASLPEVARLVRRLERGIAGDFGTDRCEVPPVPEARIGDILSTDGTIGPGELDVALDAQKRSGRRLGEELIAQGAVEPKQVAQALRAQNAAAKLKETLKVDVTRVDALVEMIGELVIVQSMVAHLPEIAGIHSPRARNYIGQLSKITRDLQGVGMSMRMVPVRGVFRKMARMVRDLGRKSGKQVKMVQDGEWTEMDRSMVERIGDPLVHMIRNAVDHGIESAEARKAAGKSLVGEISLSAYSEGSAIIIEVADDGGGLDRERIRAKAIERGLISAEETLSDAQIYDLLFSPGFSTAQEVTEISGRGVGMDVVRRNIESMRGTVVVNSKPGRGTTFKISLPLTLAIIDGMMVRCGKERYILPTLSVSESIKPKAEMVSRLADRGELLSIRGEIIPMRRLGDLLDVKGAVVDPTDGLVVIVETVGRRTALLVDEVIAQQQVVIKSLDCSIDSKWIAGAAILSDGRVGLILNVDELANEAEHGRKRSTGARSRVVNE